MRPVRSSKFLFPVSTAGPVGTLATSGIEYLRRVLAIAVVADGAGWMRSSVGGGDVAGDVVCEEVVHV